MHSALHIRPLRLGVGHSFERMFIQLVFHFHDLLIVSAKLNRSLSRNCRCEILRHEQDLFLSLQQRIIFARHLIEE